MPRTAFPVRRLAIVAAVAAYLYWLLPATAFLFYELHHLTGIDGIYWGYSGFRLAGYYFGIWPYQLPVCILAGVVVAIPWLRLVRSARSGGANA